LAEPSDDAAVINVHTILGAYSLPPIAETSYRYTITPDGRVRIATHFKPVAKLPNLPKLGLRLSLPAGFDRFTWYGRGQHESYADMKTSADVGLYSGSVQDQHVPHVRPQESGNKSDVRAAAVTNAAGIGILATGAELLNVSVRHYTTEDLTAARHIYDLPRREMTEWNLDHRQAPLGSQSCGPAPLQRYVIQANPTSFTVDLLPLRAGKNVVEMIKAVCGAV
jgi:beta-galactosidase